jgi:hypothetical protein
LLNCTIQGCKESYSEILGIRAIRDKWFVGTAEVWPQIAVAGVDKIVLCPKHRKEIFNEILEMRKTQEA